MITVKNKYTGEEQGYTLSPKEALVSAAIQEDGMTAYLSEEHWRKYYRGLIIRSNGVLKLGNWSVVQE